MDSKCDRCVEIKNEVEENCNYTNSMTNDSMMMQEFLHKHRRRMEMLEKEHQLTMRIKEIETEIEQQKLKKAQLQRELQEFKKACEGLYLC